MHGFEGGGDEVAVVAHGDVTASGEGEGRVDRHFFADGFSECLVRVSRKILWLIWICAVLLSISASSGCASS